MESTLRERLRKHNIEIDSVLGQKLSQLDNMYNEIDVVTEKIKLLKLKQEQLYEDIDMMETYLMYSFNKGTRDSLTRD